MNSRALILVCTVGCLGAGVYGWTRFQARSTRAAAPDVPLIVSSAEPERHKVTPPMLDAAEAKAGRPAPRFHRDAADGSDCDLDEMLRTGPLVLLFIKDGCPCSVAAESFFNGLHASYRGRVRFVGVIDGDASVARRWAATNGVPFPIVPDPQLELMHAYGATNSAYVALIDRDGRLDGFWPGYSVAMLHDLNSRIAALSGLSEEPIETAEAPDELYSGCPF